MNILTYKHMFAKHVSSIKNLLFPQPPPAKEPSPLQIIQREMGLPVPVDVHQHIGRAVSVLARLGKATGIQNDQVLVPVLFVHLVKRTVCVAVHDDIKSPGPRLLDQALRSQGHAVIVAVGQENPVTADHDILFPVQIGEKVIVSQHKFQIAALVDPGGDLLLAPLRIA